MSKTPTTPRSRSRSKRSSTNLSDLRLAPLSAKYSPEQHRRQDRPIRTPYDEEPDVTFSRQHPSYLQGKSAPTTPGILSRSSSRRSLGGGLSRKLDEGADYFGDADADIDEQRSYTYAAPARQYVNFEAERAEMGSGNIPKAKSEGVLFLAQQRQSKLAGQAASRHRRTASRRSGTSTPKGDAAETRDDWLTHTGALASALVQEGKGQAWMANRANSTNMGPTESEEDDDDDRYEELAALSASTAKLQLGSFDGGSPMSTRVSRWGSRYGSRSASRRGSRYASPSGTRTPRRSDVQDYFDNYEVGLPTEEPGFLGPEERKGDYQDDVDLQKLSAANSFGLGNFVDRLMNFSLYKVDEGHETTDDESARQQQAKRDESPEEAKSRMTAELKRRREEKERLLAQPPPAPLGNAGDTAAGDAGGWKDAAWLLSVASKAMF